MIHASRDERLAAPQINVRADISWGWVGASRRARAGRSLGIGAIPTAKERLRPAPADQTRYCRLDQWRQRRPRVPAARASFRGLRRGRHEPALDIERRRRMRSRREFGTVREELFSHAPLSRTLTSLFAPDLRFELIVAPAVQSSRPVEVFLQDSLLPLYSSCRFKGPAHYGAELPIRSLEYTRGDDCPAIGGEGWLYLR